MDELTATILDLVRPEIERIVDERLAELQCNEWMTIEEAAEYLKISPIALAARARRGSLPAYKDGHRWVFRRDEVDATLRGQVSPSATVPRP